MPKYVWKLGGKTWTVESPRELSVQEQMAAIAREMQKSSRAGMPAVSLIDWLPVAPSTQQQQAARREPQTPPATVQGGVTQRKQAEGGVLRSLFDILSMPFRAGVAVVGASMPGKRYGVEAGEPRELTGTWTERFQQLFADPELEWGAILEKDMPFLPRILRRAIAVPADVVLDPLAFVPPAKVGRAAAKIPAVGRIAEKATSTGRGLLAFALNPSVMRKAAGLWSPAQEPFPVSLMDALAYALKHGEEVGRGAAQARQEASAKAFREWAATGAMFPPLTLSTPKMDEVVREFTPLPSPVASRQPPSPENIGYWFELKRLYEDIRREPTAAEKGLSLWKFLKTAGNLPAGAVRNFYQNFILSWLAGDKYTPRGVAAGLLDILTNWRTPWQEAGESVVRSAETGADVLSQSALKNLTQMLSQAYQTADVKAASALSKMTGKPAEEFLLQHQFLPETAHVLSRWGIMPFISWYLYATPRWAKGLMEAPHRTRSLLQLIQSAQPEEEKKFESVPIPFTERMRPGVGVMGSETRIGATLPLDPSEMVVSEGAWLPFIRQNPYVQLTLGAADALAGRGVTGARHTSTGEPAVDLAKFLAYFTLPTTVTRYVPELVLPAQPQGGMRRVPRDRLDALLSLLGIASVPRDDAYDIYRQLRERQRRERLRYMR